MSRTDGRHVSTCPKVHSGALCRRFATDPFWQTFPENAQSSVLALTGGWFALTEESSGASHVEPSQLRGPAVNFQAKVREFPKAWHLCASVERCSSLRRRTSGTGLGCGGQSLHSSCPARERGPAPDEEEQALEHQARPTATCLDQLSSSHKEGQDWVFHHRGRGQVSVFPLIEVFRRRSTSPCVHDSVSSLTKH